jgi:hypothetical protein
MAQYVNSASASPRVTQRAGPPNGFAIFSVDELMRMYLPGLARRG